MPLGKSANPGTIGWGVWDRRPFWRRSPKRDTLRMSSHTSTCRCPLHRDLEARRAECYRELARAIVGPMPNTNDAELARALAHHARTLALANNVINLPRRRAA
jgi:hypothetical protein